MPNKLTIFIFGFVLKKCYMLINEHALSWVTASSSSSSQTAADVCNHGGNLLISIAIVHAAMAKIP
uniref:Uncharacterized protein n=1 Tax=Arion vulgaris TaxID=1028688 RepID=A0A0B6Z4P5_9EUPU